MVFELESIFGHLGRHLEINSLLLSSTSNHFCPGFDREELMNMEGEDFKKLLLRLQKIVYGLYFLPQTTVCDLKLGASDLGIALSLGCDIRLAQQDIHLQFDCLKKGLAPMGIMASVLCSIVGQGHARNWIMSAKRVTGEELLNAGFISEIYPSKTSSKARELLETINQQAPVARIQAKRSLLEAMDKSLEDSLGREPFFAFAGLETEDWKKGIVAESGSTNPQYSSPLSIVQELQKERVN